MGPAGLPGEGPPALSPVLVRMLVLGVWVSQPLPDSLVPLSLSFTPVLRPASLLCCPSQGSMPRAQNAPLEGQRVSLQLLGSPQPELVGRQGCSDAHTLLGLVAILLLTWLCSSLSHSLEMNFGRGM